MTTDRLKRGGGGRDKHCLEASTFRPLRNSRDQHYSALSFVEPLASEFNFLLHQNSIYFSSLGFVSYSNDVLSESALSKSDIKELFVAYRMSFFFNNVIIVSQGIIGIAVFGELSSVRWWGGTLLIVLGLALVARSKKKDNDE